MRIIRMAKQTQKRTAVNVVLNEGEGELIIYMPLNLPPQPSASGKTLVVASTRGNIQSSAVYDGKPITIGVIRSSGQWASTKDERDESCSGGSGGIIAGHGH
jgi:hypothetical protein